jgi:hypothetical protein
MAEAGGGGADQHLVRAGLVDLHVFDLKRRADLAQDCGFHFDALPNLLRGGPARLWPEVIAVQGRGAKSFC